MEGRAGNKGKSQVSELLDHQELLNHQLEEMSLLLAKKDAEIACLNAQLLKASTEGPCSEELSSLKTQNASLTAQVEDLKDILLKTHAEDDARLSLVL